MRYINRRIKQFVVYALACLNAILHRVHKYSYYDKEVLIFLNGAIGDVLLFIAPLREYLIDLERNGYKKAIISCRPNTYELISEYINSNIVEYCVISVGYKSWPSLKDFYTVVKALRKYKFDTIVVTIHIPWLYGMSAFLNSKRYVGYLGYKTYMNKWHIRFICSMLFENVVLGTANSFVADDYESLIRILGVDYYKKTILSISSKTQTEEYIVLAPVTSNKYRNISEKQMIVLLKYLCDIYTNTIILSGTQTEKDYFDRIIESIGDNRIENYAGRTTIKQLENLIAGARLVIGADSGSIHMAALKGIPSLVLGGFWGSKFLPYEFDEDKPYYPKVIFSDREYNCQYCMDYSNKRVDRKCKKSIKHCGQYMCMSHINMDKVCLEVYKIMDNMGMIM